MSEWWSCLNPDVQDFLEIFGTLIGLIAGGMVFSFIVGFIAAKIPRLKKLVDKNARLSKNWVWYRVNLGFLIWATPFMGIAIIFLVVFVIYGIGYAIYDMIRCLVCPGC